MIKLNNINKFYNSGVEKYHALRDINIEFPNTGMFFIVGKSGSGKSTLLNIIGGIDSYDSGELIIDDLNTKDFSKADYNTYRNSYIGFIFQEFNVVKNLNVYDNIALSLRLQNKNIKEFNDLILETIKLVGLEGKEKRKMNQLSGGERQRVAIARAIIKQPKVIIADEPTGNLDKKNRDIVMETLQNLSKDHLVIVVTHDKTLSKTYGNEEIVLKDGQIIKHNFINQNNKINNVVDNETIQNISIKPSIKAPIFLSFKSLKQNLLRFILITIFFIVALIFSNTTINLYFSNATYEYASYQVDNSIYYTDDSQDPLYLNNYITISQNETLHNQNIKSGFFQIDSVNYKNLINSFNKPENNIEYQIYHSYKSSVPINKNADEFVEYYYSSSIDNYVVIEDLSKFETNYNVTKFFANTVYPLRCFITDYIADSLIVNNYYEDQASLDIAYDEYFIGKSIKIDGIARPVYIEGIIETNYKTFLEQYDLDDPSIYAIYMDNMAFYNSLFFTSSIYVGTDDGGQIVSTNNMLYTYDDFVYSALGTSGIIENVKVTSYTNEIIIKGKKPEKQPDGENLDQIAISTGLLNQAFNKTIDEVDLGDDDAPKSLVNPTTGAAASFTFYGYRRISADFNCEVVGIIESEEPIIYFCNRNETSLYYNYLKTSYSDYNNSSEDFGGTLLIKISNDVNSNTSLYQTLRDNNIVIDNLSYTKLQVVNEFIDNNLILFIGIFFALCVFSILMIFNFVVITIKNSTKDIGIYMSLGMNGMQISFIYILQILLVSTFTFILSSIGSTIFLNILDNILSEDASNIINQFYNLNMSPINFEIFKMTSYGVLISMLIAYLFPLLSVIVPLLNLAKKKPIDVLKIS